MRRHDEILAVRYFTAIVKGEPDAARRQEIYLGALEQHCPAVTIHRGHFKPKTPRGCRHCGEPWQCRCNPPTRYRTYEEKLTDVALASALLETPRQASATCLWSSPPIRTSRRPLTPRSGSHQPGRSTLPAHPDG
jgi:hypothetical protein